MDEEEEGGGADQRRKPKVQLEKIVVVTGSDDGTVGVWKPFLPNEVTSLVGHSNSVLSVSSTFNNHFLTSSSDCSVRVWAPTLPSTPSSSPSSSAAPLSSTTPVRGHTGPVTSISAACVADGEQQQVLAVSGGRDGRVMVWEVLLTEDKVRKLYEASDPDHETAISSVCLTSCSKPGTGSFMAARDDGSLNCYQFDRKVLSSPSDHVTAAGLMGPHPVSKLALTEDGKHVVAGSWSNQVSVVDVTRATSRKMGQGKEWVMDVIVAGKGVVYSIGLDGTLSTWRLPKDDPNTKSLVSSRLLNLKAPKEEGVTQALSLCAIPETDWLAVSDSRGKVSLWNRRSMRVELAKKLHSQQVGVVCPVSAGRFMSGSGDGTVKVWEVQRKRGRQGVCLTQLGQFHCQAPVTAIAPVTVATPTTKQLFLVGDSLGHVTVLQWQP